MKEIYLYQKTNKIQNWTFNFHIIQHSWALTVIKLPIALINFGTDTSTVYFLNEFGDGQLNYEDELRSTLVPIDPLKLKCQIFQFFLIEAIFFHRSNAVCFQNNNKFNIGVLTNDLCCIWQVHIWRMNIWRMDCHLTSMRR